MKTFFTLNMKNLQAFETGILKPIRAAVLAGFVLLTAATSTQAQFTSVATDVTGDNATNLPDGEDLLYFYDWSADSVYFRFDVVQVDSFATKFGAHVRANIPNATPTESWGDWQGGGVTQDTDFDYNRLITVWAVGTLPSSYTGTIGIADSVGVDAGNYTNLFSNNISIEVDTLNDWIILGLDREDFVTDAELDDTVRVIPVAGTVSDSLTWSDDIFSLGSSITVAPAPNLALPANNATNQPINVTLEWDSVAGSTDYVYEYSTDPTFLTGVTSGTSVAAEASLTGLTNYTLYYWRVQTVSNADTSIWSSIFAFNTQLADPTLLAPPNMSTGQPINGLILLWDSVPASLAHEYEYSDDPTFATNVTSAVVNDTTETLNGLAYFTTYYWRVRSTDGVDTTAWTAAWEFTTDPEPPTLLNPADNELSVPVINDTMIWSEAAGADDYWYQLANNPAFAPMIMTGTISDTDQVITSQLNHNTIHYWRVMSINTTDSSDWSDVFEFTTQLDTVTLTTPQNGANLPTQVIDFTWNNVPGATGFQLQYTTDINFQNGIVTVGSGTNSLTLSNFNNSTLYYWRVRGINGGNTGEYSPIWSFQTGVNAPILIAPADGSVDLLVGGVVLAWADTTGSLNYDYEYSEDSTFTTNVLGGNETTTTTTLPTLNHGRFYYWRVRSNDATNTSPWSEVWSFDTEELQMPNLVLPANGDTVSMDGTTLIWDLVTGATDYIINYSRDPLFGVDVEVFTVSGVGSFDTPDFFGDEGYFWRVRATDGVAYSPWSLTGNFRTFIRAPFLISPDSGSLGVGVNDFNSGTFSVALTWEDLKGAIKYQLQVSQDQTFTQASFLDINVFNNSYTVAGLPSFTTFFWRVFSIGPNIESDWSNIWVFTTAEDLTSVSTLANDEYFDVFPNPSDGLYQVRFNGELGETSIFRVYNNLGQQVLQQSITGHQQSALDLRNWEAGFYTLVIEDGNSVYTTKLIKH